MVQNRSHAVMAQRVEAQDSRDDFPTPPWATRALCEHIILSKGDLAIQSCLEPACVRIPVKATMESDAWRPVDPVDDDQGGA
jgi:hypothetical protein